MMAGRLIAAVMVILLGGTFEHAASAADPARPNSFAPQLPTPLAPADNATGQLLAVNLQVQVQDPESEPLSVSFRGRELVPGTGSEWTLIVLPDTQYYARSYPATFTAQTQWIMANRVALNIPFVTHLGDIVNSSDDAAQWANANASMSVLEGPNPMPYGMCRGNHDVGGSSLFNQWFPVSRYAGKPWYGGSYDETNENNYQLFSAGGLDYVIVHLDYHTTPSQEEMAWADSVFKRYPGRRAILTCHDLMSKTIPNAFSTSGQIIFDTLKNNPNLFLMLAGHCSDMMESRRADLVDGRWIHTCMSDYQDRSRGGDGWLRMMRFVPSRHCIEVQTYSPTLNRYETDSDSQFTIDCVLADLPPAPQLGQFADVPSGSTVSAIWSGLRPGRRYEWQVVVSDGTATTISPVWRFTTSNSLVDNNQDGDVDFNDMQALRNCLSAAGVEVSAPCNRLDQDGDLDVDLDDMGLLQRCLSGPAVAFAPSCLP